MAGTGIGPSRCRVAIVTGHERRTSGKGLFVKRLNGSNSTAYYKKICQAKMKRLAKRHTHGYIEQLKFTRRLHLLRQMDLTIKTPTTRTRIFSCVVRAFLLPNDLTNHRFFFSTTTTRAAGGGGLLGPGIRSNMTAMMREEGYSTGGIRKAFEATSETNDDFIRVGKAVQHFVMGTAKD